MVDELHLMIGPKVVAGDGRAFEGVSATELRLIGIRTWAGRYDAHNAATSPPNVLPCTRSGFRSPVRRQNLNSSMSAAVAWSYRTPLASEKFNHTLMTGRTCG